MRMPAGQCGTAATRHKNERASAGGQGRSDDGQGCESGRGAPVGGGDCGAAGEPAFAQTKELSDKSVLTLMDMPGGWCRRSSPRRLAKDHHRRQDPSQRESWSRSIPRARSSAWRACRPTRSSASCPRSSAPTTRADAPRGSLRPSGPTSRWCSSTSCICSPSMTLTGKVQAGREGRRQAGRRAGRFQGPAKPRPARTPSARRCRTSWPVILRLHPGTPAAGHPRPPTAEPRRASAQSRCTGTGDRNSRFAVPARRAH